MSRRTRRHVGYLRFCVLALLLTGGFWFAQQHKLIHTTSSPCGRHLKLSDPAVSTHRLNLIKTWKRDGYIVAIRGTDTETGQSMTLNTINKNQADNPTTPDVEYLRVGQTYTMKIYVYTQTDKHAGCTESRVYAYVVQIRTGAQPAPTPTHAAPQPTSI